MQRCSTPGSIWGDKDLTHEIYWSDRGRYLNIELEEWGFSNGVIFERGMIVSCEIFVLHQHILAGIVG